jgi:hypothetical protein
LKLNGTHQFLFYADDVNMLGGSVYTKYIRWLFASKEIGLELNDDQTNYMVITRNLNAG